LKFSLPVSELRGDARRIENYLKKLKSRKVIEQLIEYPDSFKEIITKGQSGPDLSGLIRRS
jgi:hypothetical protein